MAAFGNFHNTNKQRSHISEAKTLDPIKRTIDPIKNVPVYAARVYPDTIEHLSQVLPRSGSAGRSADSPRCTATLTCGTQSVHAQVRGILASNIRTCLKHNIRVAPPLPPPRLSVHDPWRLMKAHRHRWLRLQGPRPLEARRHTETPHLALSAIPQCLGPAACRSCSAKSMAHGVHVYQGSAFHPPRCDERCKPNQSARKHFFGTEYERLCSNASHKGSCAQVCFCGCQTKNSLHTRTSTSRETVMRTCTVGHAVGPLNHVPMPTSLLLHRCTQRRRQ